MTNNKKPGLSGALGRFFDVFRHKEQLAVANKIEARRKEARLDLDRAIEELAAARTRKRQRDA